MGRTWHSPPGSGIWMSFILKPNIPLIATPHLTLLFSVAVTRALHTETGIDVLHQVAQRFIYCRSEVCGFDQVRAEPERVPTVWPELGLTSMQPQGNICPNRYGRRPSPSARSQKNRCAEPRLSPPVALRLKISCRCTRKKGFHPFVRCGRVMPLC